MKFMSKYNSYLISHGEIGQIRFDAGCYETEVEKEIEVLKSLKAFGDEFFIVNEDDNKAIENAKEELAKKSTAKK